VLANRVLLLETETSMTCVVKDRFSIVPIAFFKTGSDPQGSLQTRYSYMTVFQSLNLFVKRRFAIPWRSQRWNGGYRTSGRLCLPPEKLTGSSW